MRPINGYILIKVEKKPTKTSSGVKIVNDQENRLERAEVLAVPDMCMDICPKDFIYYKTFSLDTIQIDGKELNFVKADDVLAIE